MLFEVEDKLNEINILRGIGVLAVLLIHLTSSFYKYEYFSYSYLFYGGINLFLCFAVPLFMFLSAFSLTYNAKKKVNFKLGDFYSKRFLKILAPYLFWTFVYVLYFELSDSNPISIFSEPNLFFVEYILLGRACYHLYFVPIIAQLYLIFPLLRFFFFRIKRRIYFREEKNKNIYFLIMFTGVSLLLILLQYLFIQFNAEYIYENFKNTATICFSYIIPIGMGLWIGYNWYDWKVVKNYARIIIYPIVMILGSVYINFMLNVCDFGLSGRIIGLIRNVYVAFVILFFLDIAIKFSKKDNGVNRFLMRLGCNSMTIYFLHPLIMYIINDWGWFKFNFAQNDFIDFSINFSFRFMFVLVISYFFAKWINDFKIKCRC